MSTLIVDHTSGLASHPAASSAELASPVPCPVLPLGPLEHSNDPPSSHRTGSRVPMGNSRRWCQDSGRHPVPAECPPAPSRAGQLYPSSSSGSTAGPERGSHQGYRGRESERDGRRGGSSRRRDYASRADVVHDIVGDSGRDECEMEGFSFGSADMPPGGGSSTPGKVVDGDVLPRRPRCRISGRSTEKKNLGNLEFERQIAAFQARQEQRRQNQMSAFLGSCYRVCLPYWNILSTDVEDGENPIPWKDVFEFPGPSAPLLLKAGSQQGEERLLKDSAKPPDTDFLEGTFIKINSDKQKATRNKKNSKKKGKGKGRKQSHASEIKSDPSPTKPSSTCADVAGGEALVSSSSHVAVGVPLLEYSSPSSSLVTQILINPAISGASSEKELSSSSKDGFESFDSTTSYSTAASSSVNDYYNGGNNSWNNTMGDYAGSLSDARSERPLSASECIDSRGFKNRSGEGSKPNDHQSFSLAIGPGGSQEGSLCRDYASNGGDFQKVISRKAAQKMKRMQRLESPAMAASGPIIARALVPSAPRREVITIGHYIKEDCFYGREPNHKMKGKNQKGSSLSNVSKTGYTDGENVPGISSRMLLITVHTGKPGSSQMALSSTSCHHVTLEDIEETSSPGCLPMEGDLKTPVCGDTEDTDSRAPSSDDKTSSLCNLANSSCVDSEEQEKNMAPVAVGGDTEGTDSTATSSDKTSSQLGHLANSSCVDREEQKKDMAPVGGDTKDTDYTAPSSPDKTSSLADHLANSSCVDREEQKKAMAPVGGDSDTKDTDSIAPSSDKTSSSLGHLSNSSCVKREEQKKQENEQAFSTHASSELDKIIKAANDAYKIQAASDAYMIYGVHADIETFLHSATPVIAQISCTTNNISLQDQCMWSVWRWYEEPECCGIEVEMQGSINSSWANSSTYFVPSLSAVQLFGQAGNKFTTPEEPCLLSQNHGGLLFEYFESEMPFLRPPLFTKIKQLLNGVNLAGTPIFGDPKQLKSVKLSDLHRASWFCVSWYPISQIPSTSRSRQAAFLTYHSLGKLVPQTCPTYMADGLHRIICPVVGLLGYRDQGEKWYQLGEQSRSKPTPNGSWKTHPAELLNKKMRALRHCASIMSKAVVPRASGEAMNYHPDYEFFWSRSQ